MAMSVSGLKNRIISKVNVRIRPRFKPIPSDDHKLSGYDFDDYWDDVAAIIAESVHEEITINARCSGIDTPGGDAHSNVQII
ncbi:MAG: hypothetical protein GWN93_27055 [Deltaproteobacteria bacterium]|nr:hypothetical protein [Deltaproteobacteria bacterium]